VVTTQPSYPVRFDWGPAGAASITGGAAFVVIVDVLSFTTTLTVAAERGIEVMPYRWRDESAERVAREHDATLAVGRSRAGPGEVSLSPATVLSATGVRRLILPSPNGATIAASVADLGGAVIGVSLRNAAAAGAWVRRRLADGPVAVIAAGERWPDGSLRPAVEDLWGAGAFLDALGGNDDLDGGDGRSPEVGMAIAAYRAVANDLPAALRTCVSGRELIDAGFAGDVAVAAEPGSTVVPLLVDGWFRV
jgi:2-phosphosulfolactate phosphatase